MEGLVHELGTGEEVLHRLRLSGLPGSGQPLAGLGFQPGEAQAQQPFPGEALVPSVQHPRRYRAAVPRRHDLLQFGFPGRVRYFLADATDDEILRFHRHVDGVEETPEALAQLQGLRQAGNVEVRLAGEAEPFQRGAAYRLVARRNRCGRRHGHRRSSGARAGQTHGRDGGTAAAGAKGRPPASAR